MLNSKFAVHLSYALLAPVTLRFFGYTKSHGQSAARMKDATTTRRKPTTRDMDVSV